MKKIQTLSDIGEFSFIENIKIWLKNQKIHSNENIVGIGDDAAVINSKILTSIDTLVEGVHFTSEITSFYDLGWKSLAVNISDIAAMGGIPKYATISFACPSTTTIKDLQEFYFGFQELSQIANVALIGGDTVKIDSKIVISVSIIGETINGNYFLRSTAKDGDYICTTGTFGDSAFGLNQLLQYQKTSEYFNSRFNRPMPRFVEAKFLGENNLVNAMMDVSDGLSFTINEIASQSKVGIIIEESKIPLSLELKSIATKESYLNYALYGGEDYELVFSTPKENIRIIQNNLKNISIIGEVSKDFNGVKVKTNEGAILNLENKGYVAF